MDIQNAYLSAPIKGRYWYRCGLEFGSDKGRLAKIVRALYGLKSAGRTFRNHLAGTLRKMGFVSTKADPDVWIRPATKPDGTKYYEYLLAYVDDILAASHDVKAIYEQLGSLFTFKETPADPKLYLGADVTKWYIENSDEPTKVRWAMSSENYTKKVLQEVERELEEAGRSLPKKTVTPLSSGYRPEIDMSEELDPTRQNYFQGLIGILRWLVELGRLDIMVPVSMLSRYLVSARVGHLDQVFHIFAYLKAHNRSTMVFDDTEPIIEGTRFVKRDWEDYYPEAAEMIPPDMPEPRGEPVVITCFTDADHAGCQATRRSHSGIIIFAN